MLNLNSPSNKALSAIFVVGAFFVMIAAQNADATNYNHPPAPGGGYHAPASGGGYHPPAAAPAYHPPSAPPAYHPPAGGNYHPPSAPPAYHPPAGGNYHPPTAPPAYHPPAGGNYHPPSAPPAYHPPAGGNYHPPSNPGGHAPGGHAPVGPGGHNPGGDHNFGGHQPIEHNHSGDVRRAGDRVGEMRGDHRVNDHVGREGREYTERYRGDVDRRYHEYGRFHDHYRPYFGRYWYPWHFWGFYWALSVELAINQYYYNPLVCWLYCVSYDPYFYQRWYGADYYRYNDTVWTRPFYRAGVYMPTVDLKDLLIAAGVWPVERQYLLRAGLTAVAQNLEAQMSTDLGRGVEFDRNAISITHVQQLDGAVVLYGTATYGDVAGAITALVYLDRANSNIVFMPNPTEPQPTQEEQDSLNYLNEKIIEAGGTVDNP